MQQKSFTTAFTVDQSPKEAFDAIKNVRGWWGGELEGSAENVGDEFIYQYKDLHFSKQKVTELVQEKKVVWLVTESSLNFIKDKKEWNGTKMTFDIAPRGNNTEVRFTHVGLTPDIECYGACSSAWDSIIKESLRSLIVTGNGRLTLLG
jgi:Activator of Hsp90 ATPase homolog 1-like protein